MRLETKFKNKPTGKDVNICDYITHTFVTIR